MVVSRRDFSGRSRLLGAKWYYDALFPLLSPPEQLALTSPTHTLASAGQRRGQAGHRLRDVDLQHLPLHLLSP